MGIEAELFDDYSIDEMKQGFFEDHKGYTCLMCGERFEKGEIYSFSGKLYEGQKAIKLHIEHKHHSVTNVLLEMNADYMGISELQLQLLNFFEQGLSDKEIAARLDVSSSTIRNHRYKLRERERQNKLFIALMELLKEDGAVSKMSLQADKNKVDEAGYVSDKERKRILEHYMTTSGRLKDYPSLDRSKRVILEAILVNFYMGKKYAEEEIDRILMSIYNEYKMLKKELVAYGYLGRTHTGAIYWVKGYSNTRHLERVAR